MTESNYPPVPKQIRLSFVSFACGILAFPVAILDPRDGTLGLGVLFGILALVLGIIAHHFIRRHPDRHSGSGLATIGILTGALGGIIITPLLLASLQRVHDNNRTPCGANINGIVKAMLVYANENDNSLPCPPAGTSSPVYRSVAYDPHTVAGNNNSLAVLAIVVAEGGCSPKSFICRDDPFVASVGTTAANGIVNVASDQNSYSIVSPWSSATSSSTIGGWWKANIDAQQPLMGDMALLGPGLAGIAGACSINHKCLGQNVAFADAHCEWVRDMTAIKGDKISIDIDGTTPNPIPDSPPYRVWFTPHKTTGGVITAP